MRLILHIGHYKTGTTSLQRRFTTHRDALARAGVHYPDLGELRNPNGTVLPSHSALTFEMLARRDLPTPFWYKDLVRRCEDPPTLESMIDRLQTAMAAAGDDDVLLSSEELMRFGSGEGTAGMVDELATLIGDHDIRVFCHLRRPDVHLPSWYNQLIKLGARRANLSASIETYFDKIHVDYAKALRPWVERFGADHVEVRRYEHRDGDVSDDVLSAYGRALDPAHGNPVWENERFPDVFVETLRIWNDFQTEADVNATALAAMRRLAERPPFSEETVEFLTPAARRALYARSVDMAVELDALLGRSTPLFDDLDAMLEPTPDAITDVEANRRHARAVFRDLLGGADADPDAPAIPIEVPQAIAAPAARLGQRARRTVDRFRRRPPRLSN